MDSAGKRPRRLRAKYTPRTNLAICTRGISLLRRADVYKRQLPRLVEVPGYRDLRLEQLRRHQTEICFQLLVGIVEYTVSPGHCQLRRHIPRALVAVAVHFPQGVAERQVFPDGVEPDLLQVDQAEVVVAGRTALL